MDNKFYTSNSNTFVMPPTTLNIFDAVTIHQDGRVEVNPKYTTDEAAKLFWDAVIKLAPDFFDKDRLNEKIFKLESMCRAAGYDSMQIKAGTPYVELIGG